MRWTLALLMAAALSFGATATQAAPVRAAKSAASRSLGSPSEGRLVGGKRLSKAKGLRVVGALRFALPEMVDMLEGSAERVAKAHPGAVLTVGNLSRQGGGEVEGHRSHESGRDADVGFYLSFANGKSFLPPRFAAIDAEGKAVGYPSVHFDDAKNWQLVSSWLTDPKARVLQVFVAHHLRQRLLAQAARVGAPANVRARAAEVLLQPSRALPHDNHFHVRIACPAGQKECENFAKRKKAVALQAKAAKARASRRRSRARASAPAATKR